MAADGKWIEGLTPELKLADAAERVFQARLDAVENQWRAALESVDDPEAVHQMRVTTRRARAAVQVFGDLLPKRIESALSRLLRQLRRAASGARDWDVFAIEVSEWAKSRPAIEKPGLDLLIGVAIGRRCDTQHELDASRDCRDSWDNLRGKIKIRSGKRTRLRQRAEIVVPQMVQTFNTVATEDLTNPEKLHQLRIAGKQLRYALELFADALGPDVHDRIMPAIESVQDILGAANDAQNHLEQVNEIVPFINRLDPTEVASVHPGVEEWRQHLLEEAAAGSDRFRQWEQQWRSIAASIDYSS